jgi:hypothetical protein
MTLKKTSLTCNFKWRFFLFPLLLIFISCAALSPVGLTRDEPETFARIETVQPQWQQFAAGIGYFHGKISEPLLEFWALQIEYTSPGISVVVKGGLSGGRSSDVQTVRSVKVSGFVRRNSLVAGINALPFDVISAIEGRRINNAGLVISGGLLVSPAIPQFDALVFYTDGTAAIISQSEIHSTEFIENAAGGFRKILENGELLEHTLNLEPRHPRSAAGISSDNKYLYLLVIDGRRAGSIGSTEKETAMLLCALGASEGINLDGGGSSCLALRFPNGRIRPVNTPIHGGIKGLERAVAGCIGIASDKK